MSFRINLPHLKIKEKTEVTHDFLAFGFKSKQLRSLYNLWANSKVTIYYTVILKSGSTRVGRRTVYLACLIAAHNIRCRSRAIQAIGNSKEQASLMNKIIEV